MLCSRCYKKIPEGEEVKRGSSGIYWRAGYWWGEGGRSGIFCVRCAKLQKREEKRLWIMFWFAFFAVFILIILAMVFSMILRG